MLFSTNAMSAFAESFDVDNSITNHIAETTKIKTETDNDDSESTTYEETTNVEATQHDSDEESTMDVGAEIICSS